MEKYYEVGDLVRLMYRRHHPIGSASGLRKAILAGRITPTGRTIGRGTYIWNEEDAQALLRMQEERKQLREEQPALSPKPHHKLKARPRR